MNRRILTLMALSLFWMSASAAVTRLRTFL